MSIAARLGAPLLLAGALAGCGSVGTSAPDVPPVSRPAQAQSSPSGLPGQACSESTLAGIEQLVTEQLAAFANRDFNTAYGLASEQFKAMSTPESLKQLILDGKHAEVLDSASHEFSDCREPHPDLAVAAVSVTGVNGETVSLEYQFSREQGQWRILMSRPVGSTGGGPPVVGA
jgi:hypothetical protein